jgi:hypothetical protein
VDAKKKTQRIKGDPELTEVIQGALEGKMPKNSTPRPPGCSIRLTKEEQGREKPRKRPKRWRWPEFEILHRPTKELLESEWNFHKIFDKDQKILESCLIYEYARSTPWIVQAFDHTKQGIPPPKGVTWEFEKNGTWLFESDEDSDFDGICFQLPPGFPDKPYVETEMRQATHRRTDDPFSYPALEEIPREEFMASTKEEGFVTACFRIRYDLPTTSVCTAFEAWLKESHKKPGRKPKRKSKNKKQVTRPLLVQLGLFRLFAFYDLTRPEVEKIFEDTLAAPYRGPEAPRMQQDTSGPPIEFTPEKKHFDRFFDNVRKTLERHFVSGEIPRLREILKLLKKHRSSDS